MHTYFRYYHVEFFVGHCEGLYFSNDIKTVKWHNYASLAFKTSFETTVYLFSKMGEK